jgi:hypothetical protein
MLIGWLGCVAFLAGFASGGDGEARGAPATTQEITAVVVIVDKLPLTDAQFVIQRRPNLIPHDVILVPRNVDERTLSDAIRALATARFAGGDRPVAAATIRQRSGTEKPRAPFPHAVRLVRALRAAKPGNVAGIGVAKFIVISLPAQKPRR